jgi:hypothetical protein
MASNSLTITITHYLLTNNNIVSGDIDSKAS